MQEEDFDLIAHGIEGLDYANYDEYYQDAENWVNEYLSYCAQFNDDDCPF